jgi:predicted lipoprotein with Yx(FWY)xxD motif
VKKPLILACAALVAVLLAGCGSSSKSSSATTTTTASTAAAASASSTTASTQTAATTASAVAVSTKHSKLGMILAAGPKKLTVYMFEADKGGQSACSGACAKVWPPVTSAAGAQAAGAAVAAALGRMTRSDGTTQITYKGHPLYFYDDDKDSGDAYGQGSNAFGAGWYVLKPDGSKLDEGAKKGGGGNAS